MTISIQQDPLILLNGRSKRMEGFSYGVKENINHYGLDIAFSDDPELDESKMSIWIPFVDGNRRDGVGDKLEVGGIRLDRHRANPISLFDHGKQETLPIAMALERDETGRYDINKYTVELDPVGQTGRLNAFFYQGKGMENVTREKEYNHAIFCEQIYHMASMGMVRGGSIGYQVIKALQLQPDYDTGTPQGLHLLSVLMLEGSLVVLPANQDTVMKCLSCGEMCGKALSPVLVKSLSAYAPERVKTVVGFTGRKGLNWGDFVRITIDVGPFQGKMGRIAEKPKGDGYILVKIDGGKVEKIPEQYVEKQSGKAMDEEENKCIDPPTGSSRYAQAELDPDGLGVDESFVIDVVEMKSIREKYRVKASLDDNLEDQGWMPKFVRNMDDRDLITEQCERELTNWQRAKQEHYRATSISQRQRHRREFEQAHDALKRAFETAKRRQGKSLGKKAIDQELARTFHYEFTKIGYGLGRPRIQGDDLVYNTPDPEDAEMIAGDIPLVLSRIGARGVAKARGRDLIITFQKSIKASPGPTENSSPHARRSQDVLYYDFNEGDKVTVRSAISYPVSGKTEIFAMPGDRVRILSIRNPQEVEVERNDGKTTRTNLGKLRKSMDIKSIRTRYRKTIEEDKGEEKSLAVSHKSLDLNEVRKKYRTTKGLRRRLKKSSPGSSIVHIEKKDMDLVREEAEKKGLQCKWMGTKDNGLESVKLSGDDNAIDQVAKTYGRIYR